MRDTLETSFGCIKQNPRNRAFLDCLIQRSHSVDFWVAIKDIHTLLTDAGIRSFQIMINHGDMFHMYKCAAQVKLKFAEDWDKLLPSRHQPPPTFEVMAGQKWIDMVEEEEAEQERERLLRDDMFALELEDP